MKAPRNMSKGNDLGLLDLLKNKGNGAEALAALAAKAPAHEAADGTAPAVDAKLNDVLNRISQLTGADVRRGDAAAAGQTPMIRSASGTPSSGAAVSPAASPAASAAP